MKTILLIGTIGSIITGVIAGTINIILGRWELAALNILIVGMMIIASILIAKNKDI